MTVLRLLLLLLQLTKFGSDQPLRHVRCVQDGFTASKRASQSGHKEVAKLLRRKQEKKKQKRKPEL